MNKEDLSRRFCAKPFEYFSVHQEGEVSCCCRGWLPKNIGSLQTNEFMDVWNSDAAQEIRASILDGTFKYCRTKQCPLIGNNTLPYREDVSDPDLKEIIENGLTVLKKKPKNMNLAYDRSCNLSCPSCRTEPIMLKKGSEYDRKKQLQDRLLADGLDDAEMLIVTGSGDPFASELYRTLLATLDSEQYPKLKVHLITNAQLFTPQIWEKWHKIHKSIKGVQISIDAASEETYRILRRGGEFKRLLVNLEFVRSLKNKGILDWVSIEFVVQEKNYKEMKDFVKLGKSFDFDRVGFAGIRNLGTYGDEFHLEAVHISSHPKYHELLEVLKDPIFKDPIVDLGNITQLLPN